MPSISSHNQSEDFKALNPNTILLHKVKLFKYTHSKRVSTQCAFYGWDVNPVQKKTKKGQKINIRNTLVNGIYWFGLPTYTFIRLHTSSKYWI